MVEKTSRKVRIHTHQEVMPDLPPIQEGFPMRKWTIDIHLLNAQGQPVPAIVFDKVTYKLHPTFEVPIRTEKEPPFSLTETGWGEFEMHIVLSFADRGGEHTVKYDLSFAAADAHKDFTVQFPLNKPGLVALLAESGPVGAPKPEKRQAETTTESKPKRAKAVKGLVDLEKLAAGMEKLAEEDVLGIVQMISDNKTPDIYVKNDADAGEFHIDLFTLPNGLLKSLWAYVSQRVDVS